MRIGSRREEVPTWFEAMPVQLQVVSAVSVVGLFAGGNLLSHAPFLDGFARHLASGGGTVLAGFTALFIYWAFGRRARTDKANALGRRAARSPENEILLGSGGRANRSAANALSVVGHLSKIADRDPTFSVPVFHDLCRVLFRKAAEAETDADWAALRPFIAPVGQNVLKGILKRKKHPDIQVGWVHILHVEEQAAWVFMRIRIHALVCDEDGEWRFLDMTWDLRRGSTARSMTPMDVANLGCPACGSPIELTSLGHCAVCDTGIGHGQLNWQITDVGWRSGETLRPEGLGPDSGGDDPSLTPVTPLDPQLARNLRGLAMRHDTFELDVLEKRIIATAEALHKALHQGDISALAPYATRGMLETVGLRIQRLKAANLQWRRDEVHVLEVEAVRAFQDGWHEMIDVRIELRLLSAIADMDGEIEAGSLTHPRHSSTYMSFSLPISNDPYDPEGWKLWRTVRPMDFLQ